MRFVVPLISCEVGIVRIAFDITLMYRRSFFMKLNVEARLQALRGGESLTATWNFPLLCGGTYAIEVVRAWIPTHLQDSCSSVCKSEGGKAWKNDELRVGTEFRCYVKFVCHKVPRRSYNSKVGTM